ncbi:MAG: hypothetical protein V1900_04645 [Candidatus Aenigmatarchaeota archaeon]
MDYANGFKKQYEKISRYGEIVSTNSYSVSSHYAHISTVQCSGGCCNQRKRYEFF